jgi:hypothetical protein
LARLEYAVQAHIVALRRLLTITRRLLGGGFRERARAVAEEWYDIACRQRHRPHKTRRKSTVDHERKRPALAPGVTDRARVAKMEEVDLPL